MKRRSLSLNTRATISQQLPKDYEEKLAISHTYWKNKNTEKEIQPEHITNTNEAPLTFDMPMNRLKLTWRLTVNKVCLIWLFCFT